MILYTTVRLALTLALNDVRYSIIHCIGENICLRLEETQPPKACRLEPTDLPK